MRRSFFILPALIVLLAVMIALVTKFSEKMQLSRIYDIYEEYQQMAFQQESKNIVVVGGGLAGLSATIEASKSLKKADCGGTVILIDKQARLGGNSAKASSGINTVIPNDEQSKQSFIDDTWRSGKQKSDKELIEKLATLAPDSFQFLTSFGVDLSGTVQLGGHSQPRTRFNQAGPNVGYSITSALQKVVQDLDNVEIRPNTKMSSIISSQTPPSAVKGVHVIVNDTSTKQRIPAAAVILATGGFGASKPLLTQHAPDVAHLATTNGDFAQGEGLLAGQGVSAALTGIEHVQVHPTGFVDPADPEAPVKFLAPEKLRGVGGILVNDEGQRFIDELQTRDVVSKAILGLPSHSATVILGNQQVQAFGPLLSFYLKKGLVEKVDDINGAASKLGIKGEVLQQTISQYNGQVEQGTDDLGKKVFPGKIEGELAIMKVTPVIHYTMGGLKVNSHANVVSDSGQVIQGLYAAGEVAGGVHGTNRLAGNSLLECVVYGRVAGQEAAAIVVADNGKQ